MVFMRKFLVKYAPPERCVPCPMSGRDVFGNQLRSSKMREFWVTVGAMVLGYLMYLGIRSMFRK